MLKTIFTIYDNVAQETVGPLMVSRHEAPIIREFYDLLASPTPNLVNKHPDDFELREIGEIDEEGGVQARKMRVVATGAVWAAINRKEAEE